MVVVSSFEFMAADAQRKLVEFATAGGTVVLGPRLPSVDGRMQPDETLRRAVEATAGEPLERVGSVHPVGVGRTVYVANPTAETIQAEIGLAPAVTFVRELWEDRAVGASGTGWTLFT